MKAELQDKLVEVIGAIQLGVAKTADFAVAQLPDVAQQYILFGRVVETTQLVILLLITCFGAWLTKLSWNKIKDDFDYFITFTASGITTGVAAFFVCVVFNGAAMAWFAPKIYLIKGLAGLLK